MKVRIKKAAVVILSCVVLAGVVSVLPQSPVIIEAQAHGGRIDGHRGHKDNKNTSGISSYYYHCGGHAAHLHTGGICPYADASTETVPVTQVVENSTGWHHDGSHWKYTCTDGASLTGCWKQIDSSWYCFDGSGCMRTGWYEEKGCRYYLGDDGKMATGAIIIDGSEYYLDENGKLQ